MKFPGKRVQGAIQIFEVTLRDVITLSHKNLAPFQRGHEQNAKRKKYLLGALWGDAQVFTAVWVLESATLWLLDGYHRAKLFELGDAWLAPGHPGYVKLHTVKTKMQASDLYEQLNSLAAAKRSRDAFDSGLRECDMLYDIHSHLVMHGGRSLAVQHAAGLTGWRNTRNAVLEVKDGIRVVDQLRLEYRKADVIAGMLGVFFAVCQYSPNRERAEYFVRHVNAVEFLPAKPTAADEVILAYRRLCRRRKSNTGGAINTKLFEAGLGAFVQFLWESNRKKSQTRGDLVQPVITGMSRGEFLKAMKLL